MNNQKQRQIDFDYLKLTIDFHRHMAMLSFAGLVLASNVSINLFKSPQYKILAFISIVSFFVCILSSILSQAGHIDASKKETIYTYPLPYKFALPIGLSLVGLLFGVVSLAGFILLNWL